MFCLDAHHTCARRNIMKMTMVVHITIIIIAPKIALVIINEHDVSIAKEQRFVENMNQ